VQYGYSIWSVALPQVSKPRSSLKISDVRRSPNTQSPVAVSLGCHVPGIAQPRPNLQDTATTMAGVFKRMASVHPDPEEKLMKEFGEYVDNFLQTNLTPLPATADHTVETWLEKAPYPDWRKKELREKYLKVMNEFDSKHVRVKAFNKDENYPTYKHARGIYSRTDEFKCFVGPFFKLIEEEVYKLPYFIKHVPVADRPAYIKKFLNGDGVVYSTDYTAYESQFKKRMMENCEMRLYKYMTQYLPGFKKFVRHLKAMTGDQNIIFKWFRMIIDACRMSGEMCTSLGNGFSNLMFAKFIAAKNGDPDLKIVVEGDDGLFKTIVRLTKEMFSKLGLTIKIQAHDCLERASFCGIIFDSEELINVTEPLGVLVDFGWGNAKYARCNNYKKAVLLRCKALSLAHQYPGCPIISSLAHYGLRVTRFVRGDAIRKYLNNGHINMWEREQLLAAYRDENKIVERSPGWRTRCMVNEVFGVDISTQLKIEKYLDNKQDLSPINIPILYNIVPVEWLEFSERFTQVVSFKEMNNVVFASDGRDHVQELLQQLET